MKRAILVIMSVSAVAVTIHTGCEKKPVSAAESDAEEQGSPAEGAKQVQIVQKTAPGEAGSFVKATARKHLGEISLCFMGTALRSNTSGKVVMKWTVTATGDASNVSVDDNQGASDELVKCLIRNIETWKFPPQKHAVEVSHPFSFTLGSEVSATIREKLGGINLCYKNNASDSKSPGKVVMKWTITTTGDVKNVFANENQGASEGLVKCLIRNIETWKFPSRESDTEVSYPFSFAKDSRIYWDAAE